MSTLIFFYPHENVIVFHVIPYIGILPSCGESQNSFFHELHSTLNNIYACLLGIFHNALFLTFLFIILLIIGRNIKLKQKKNESNILSNIQ